MSRSDLRLSDSAPWSSRICPGFVRWPSPLPRESLRSKPCKQSAHESHVSDGRNGQSRRSDVRLHHWTVRPGGWIVLHGMPVTRPSRIAADVLETRKTPKRSHRSLPTRSGLSTTTQVRSRTPSRRTLRVSGSAPWYRCARRRTGVKMAGGTARDVVVSLVRLRPRVSLTPGTGFQGAVHCCVRARGLVSSVRPRFPGRYHLAG